MTRLSRPFSKTFSHFFSFPLFFELSFFIVVLDLKNGCAFKGKCIFRVLINKQCLAFCKLVSEMIMALLCLGKSPASGLRRRHEALTVRISCKVERGIYTELEGLLGENA